MVAVYSRAAAMASGTKIDSTKEAWVSAFRKISTCSAGEPRVESISVRGCRKLPLHRCVTVSWLVSATGPHYARKRWRADVCQRREVRATADGLVKSGNFSVSCPVIPA